MEKQVKHVMEHLGSLDRPTDGEIMSFYLIKELWEELESIKRYNTGYYAEDEFYRKLQSAGYIKNN